MSPLVLLREFITGTDAFNTFMADSLLSAMIEKLQDSANKNCQPGLILQLTANLEVRLGPELN